MTPISALSFSPYRNHNLDDGPEREYLPPRLAREPRRFTSDQRDSPFFA